MNKLNSKITKRDQDFAIWYTDIIKASRLCSYSSIKGFIVLEPLGYAIWEEAQKILNKMLIKDFVFVRHQKLYFVNILDQL